MSMDRTLSSRIPEEVEVRILLEQLKGRLSTYNAMAEAEIAHLKKVNEEHRHRLHSLEHCPCPVHRDPGHHCPILGLNEKLTRLDNRFWYYVGGATVLLFIFSVITNAGLQLAARYFAR